MSKIWDDKKHIVYEEPDWKCMYTMCPFVTSGECDVPPCPTCYMKIKKE